MSPGRREDAEQNIALEGRRWYYLLKMPSTLLKYNNSSSTARRRLLHAWARERS